MGIWDRFDDIASTEEVKEAQAQFAPIEAGVYEAKLVEIAPAESNNGLPMVKGRFQIVEGGRYLFYNQMLQNANYPDMTAKNIAEAVEFVSTLAGEDIVFEGLSKFAQEIEALETGGIYSIKVGYGKKDTEMKFPKLTCLSRVDTLPFDM